MRYHRANRCPNIQEPIEYNRNAELEEKKQRPKPQHGGGQGLTVFLLTATTFLFFVTNVLAAQTIDLRWLYEKKLMLEAFLSIAF